MVLQTIYCLQGKVVRETPPLASLTAMAQIQHKEAHTVPAASRKSIPWTHSRVRVLSTSIRPAASPPTLAWTHAPTLSHALVQCARTLRPRCTQPLPPTSGCPLNIATSPDALTFVHTPACPQQRHGDGGCDRHVVVIAPPSPALRLTLAFTPPLSAHCRARNSDMAAPSRQRCRCPALTLPGPCLHHLHTIALATVRYVGP